MLHVRRASVRLLLFVIIGLATSVVIGTAATVKYQSDAELIANASRVVRARVREREEATATFSTAASNCA